QLVPSLYEVKWVPQTLPKPVSVAAPSRGKWLILGDRSGAGAALSQLMSAHGDDCLVAYDGGFPARAGSEVVCVDPRDGNAVARLVGHGDWTGVIHLWSMDQSDRAADEGWLEQVRLADSAGVVSLVQA